MHYDNFFSNSTSVIWIALTTKIPPGKQSTEFTDMILIPITFYAAKWIQQVNRENQVS